MDIKTPGVTLTVNADTVLEGAYEGCSIAVNGVCLTVTKFDKQQFTVGVAPETLRVTNLGELAVGSPVNLERAAAIDGRNSGHMVQARAAERPHAGPSLTPAPPPAARAPLWRGGSLTARAASRGTWTTSGRSSRPGRTRSRSLCAPRPALRPAPRAPRALRAAGGWQVKIKTPPELIKYIVPKGFIAIDGTSLTVVESNQAESWFTVMLIEYTQKHIVLPDKPVGDKVNLEVDVIGKYVERSLAGLSERVEALEALVAKLQK